MAGEPDRPHQPRPERQPLADLPEWLGNLTALTSLDLGGNRLTTAGVAGEPDRPHQRST